MRKAKPADAKPEHVRVCYWLPRDAVRAVAQRKIDTGVGLSRIVLDALRAQGVWQPKTVGRKVAA